MGFLQHEFDDSFAFLFLPRPLPFYGDSTCLRTAHGISIKREPKKEKDNEKS